MSCPVPTAQSIPPLSIPNKSFSHILQHNNAQAHHGRRLALRGAPFRDLALPLALGLALALALAAPLPFLPLVMWSSSSSALVLALEEA